MLWARVFKASGLWADQWDNDYFFDVALSTSTPDIQLGQQIAFWDMSLHSTSCGLTIAYYGDPENANSCDYHGLACWVKEAGVMYGRRDISGVKPFRWALRNTNYFLMGRPSHKYYRFALGDNNVTVDSEGRLWYHGDEYIDHTRQDELNINCNRLLGKEMVGRGSPTTGASLIYEKPIKTVTKGASFLNASRRAYARRIKPVVQGVSTMNNAVIAAMTSWHVCHGMWVIQYADYWPHEMKDRAVEVVSAMVYLKQAFSSMCGTELQNGETVGDNYMPLNGPTVNAVQTQIGRLATKAEADLEALSQIIPFQSFDGEYYYSLPDATHIWGIVEDYYKKLAVAGWFDGTSTICEGAGDRDRVGGYTKGFPDL